MAVLLIRWFARRPVRCGDDATWQLRQHYADPEVTVPSSAAVRTGLRIAMKRRPSTVGPIPERVLAPEWEEA
jgi:hypothetical protein